MSDSRIEAGIRMNRLQVLLQKCQQPYGDETIALLRG
jgi:hypothetical protein